MIGRCTHVVDCRETSGMGKGGSLAQRGTFAECGTDVCAIAMSPGRRHITKPVCEITFGLREANILTSTMRVCRQLEISEGESPASNRGRSRPGW